MDNISVIIKRITNDNLYIDYINSLFNDFNIDKSTIKEVNFKNSIAIVSFNIVISKDRFLNLEFKTQHIINFLNCHLYHLSPGNWG